MVAGLRHLLACDVQSWDGLMVEYVLLSSSFLGGERVRRHKGYCRVSHMHLCAVRVMCPLCCTSDHLDWLTKI
jgi:hypothetical protein